MMLATLSDLPAPLQALRACSCLPEAIVTQLRLRAEGAARVSTQRRFDDQDVAYAPNHRATPAAAPTLLVSGGTQRSRTAVALAYLDELVDASVVRQGRSIVVDADTVGLLHELEGEDDASPGSEEDGESWSERARQLRLAMAEADCIVVLEVNSSTRGLRTLADLAHRGRPVILTSNLPLVVTDDLAGINDLTVEAARRTREAFGLRLENFDAIPILGDEVPTGMLQCLESSELGSAWRFCVASGGLAVAAPEDLVFGKPSADEPRVDATDRAWFERVATGSSLEDALNLAEPRVAELVARCAKDEPHHYWYGDAHHSDPVARAGVRRLLRQLVGAERDPSGMHLRELARVALREIEAPEKPRSAPPPVAPWEPSDCLLDPFDEFSPRDDRPLTWGHHVGHPNDTTAKQAEAWLLSDVAAGLAESIVQRAQPTKASD